MNLQRLLRDGDFGAKAIGTGGAEQTTAITKHDVATALVLKGYLSTMKYDIVPFDASIHSDDTHHHDRGDKPLLVWWGDAEDDASSTMQKRALVDPGVGYLTSRYYYGTPTETAEICTIMLDGKKYELVDVRSEREEAGFDEQGERRYRQKFCIADAVTGDQHDMYLVQKGAGLQMELLPQQVARNENDPEEWLGSEVHYHGMAYHIDSYDIEKDIYAKILNEEAQYDPSAVSFRLVFPGHHDVITQKRILLSGKVDGIPGYVLCSGDATSLLTVPQYQPAPEAANMSLVNFDKVQHVENEEELAGVVVDIDPKMHTFIDKANQFQCGYLCKYLVNDVITDGVLMRKENGAFACVSQDIISYHPGGDCSTSAELPSFMTQYVIGEADHQTAVLSDSRGLPLFFQGKNILAIKDVFPLAEKRGCFHATINQVDASDTAYDQRVVCVWSDDGVVKFAPIPSK